MPDPGPRSTRSGRKEIIDGRAFTQEPRICCNLKMGARDWGGYTKQCVGSCSTVSTEEVTLIDEFWRMTRMGHLDCGRVERRRNPICHSPVACAPTTKELLHQRCAERLPRRRLIVSGLSAGVQQDQLIEMRLHSFEDELFLQQIDFDVLCRGRCKCTSWPMAAK